MSLPPDRRQRVDEICDAALGLPAGEREAFLREACRGDEGIQREVEALLAGASRAEAILQEPVGAMAARLMGSSERAAARTLPAGTRIGTYEIVSLIGFGGMGEVYRARDKKLGRDVALKVIAEALANDSDRLVRFEREARSLAAFSHPNIAQIYGFEESGGLRAIAMELVDGTDLARRLQRAPLPFDQTVSLIRQVVDALEAAHEKGIVHRDLKPSNIMVTAAARVKILDFGFGQSHRNERPD